MDRSLYLVTLQGMNTSANGAPHGIAYVIASNPSEAYDIVKHDLDKRDIGFSVDRALKTVELIAKTGINPGAPTKLYIADK